MFVVDIWYEFCNILGLGFVVFCIGLWLQSSNANEVEIPIENDLAVANEPLVSSKDKILMTNEKKYEFEEWDFKLSKDNKKYMEWDGAENICLDYLENLYNALHNDKISTVPERIISHPQQAALGNDSFSEEAISIVSHPVTPTMQSPEEQMMVYPRDKDVEEIGTSADEVHTEYAKCDLRKSKKKGFLYYMTWAFCCMDPEALSKELDEMGPRYVRVSYPNQKLTPEECRRLLSKYNFQKEIHN